MAACKVVSYFGDIQSLTPRLRIAHGHQCREFAAFSARCPSRGKYCFKLRLKVPCSRQPVGPLGAPQGYTVKQRKTSKMKALNGPTVVVEGDRLDVQALKDALKFDSFPLSAYDTAWVARIPDEKASGPLYPQTLEWISHNQRHDGAWEDAHSVCSFDLIHSTLACVVSLGTWNFAPERKKKGEQFLQSALNIMKDDDLTCVCSGITHAFAELLEEASRLNIRLPYACPVMKAIRNKHSLLLNSLRGQDLLKSCPRRLLSFPEGLQSVLSWHDILQLQTLGGDLFSSPAATACLIIKTRDSNALSYMDRLLNRFGSAVPSMYPKRLSHVLSLIDHLERLNIDRFFHTEITDLLGSISRGWNLKIDYETEDLMDHVLCFRTLREHGYSVLPETSAFARCCSQFAEDEKLGPACMLELYRASDLGFPGEEVLEYAKDKATNYLKALLTRITDSEQSSLREEIKDVLGFPLFMRNRVVESMSYIDRFQFQNKTAESYTERTFSRTTHAGNLQLVALAKHSFNSSQSIYQEELRDLGRWEEEMEFMAVPYVRQVLLPSHITSIGFASPPGLALPRSCWAKSSVLTTMIDDLFDETTEIHELKAFVECVRSWDLSLVENCSECLKIIARGLLSTVDTLIEEANRVQERDCSHLFRSLWLDLVVSMMTEAEWTASGYIPSADEYVETSWVSFAIGPISPVSALFLGEKISTEDCESQEFWDCFRTIASFGRLLNDSRTYQREAQGGGHNSVTLYMREFPGTTIEQANKIIDERLHELLSKSFSKVLNPSYSLSPLRGGWLAMLRALYFVYHQGVDGFSNTPTEVKKILKRVYFQPFPLDTV